MCFPPFCVLGLDNYSKNVRQCEIRHLPHRLSLFAARHTGIERSRAARFLRLLSGGWRNDVNGWGAPRRLRRDATGQKESWRREAEFLKWHRETRGKRRPAKERKAARFVGARARRVSLCRAESCRFGRYLPARECPDRTAKVTRFRAVPRVEVNWRKAGTRGTRERRLAAPAAIMKRMRLASRMRGRNRRDGARSRAL